MKQLTVSMVFMLTSSMVSATSTTPSFEDYAVVTNTRPEYSVAPDREECIKVDQLPTHQSSSRDLTGPILGGLVGAVLGNTVGKGSGKKAAIGAGAITGAVVGDRWPRSNTPTEVLKCRLVPGERMITGYSVTVQYNNRHIDMRYPENIAIGRRIPVSVNVTLPATLSREYDHSFSGNDGDYYYKPTR